MVGKHSVRQSLVILCYYFLLLISAWQVGHKASVWFLVVSVRLVDTVLCNMVNLHTKCFRNTFPVCSQSIGVNLLRTLTLSIMNGFVECLNCAFCISVFWKLWSNQKPWLSIHCIPQISNTTSFTFPCLTAFHFYKQLVCVPCVW
jgi:hypothetical protein